MDCVKSHRRSLILILTPLLLIPLLPLHQQIGLDQRACNCLYMVLLMGVYWCTETLPLAVTALIPLSLAPLMGILEASAVCRGYFKDKIVLLFGSMVVALTIQQSGLHRRIALTFIKIFGIKPRFLMLGFMVPTWLLSMWISNTATSVMMVSILNCVITKLEQHNNLDQPEQSNSEEACALNDLSTVLPKLDLDIEIDTVSEDSYKLKKRSQSWNRFEPTAKCLCLAVCYSATCGGVATLTGTGTNLVFYDFTVEFGEKLNYDFGITLPKWMSFALPISAILLVICWVWLQILFLGIRKSSMLKPEDLKKIAQVIDGEYATLGKLCWQEGVALAHFIALVILWLSRDPGKAGGWGNLFPKSFATDGTASMVVMLSVMLFPKYPPLILHLKTSKPYEPMLPWKVVSEKTSWGILFLMGGGLSLAECVDKSGLSEAIGQSLSSLSVLPLWATVLIICILTASLTEVTSNMVISALLMPIVGNMAIRMELNPLYFMVPCCVSASFAFMLPVATPPNAVVYSAGVLRISDMVKAGAVLNIIAILVVTVASLTWAPPIFDFNGLIYNSSTTSQVGNMTVT